MFFHRPCFRRVLLPLLVAGSGAWGVGTLQAQVTLADLAGDYGTTASPLADTFGTGTWSYETSTTANPIAGLSTPLVFQGPSAVGAGPTGYFAPPNPGTFPEPVVSNQAVSHSGATPPPSFLAWQPAGISPAFTVVRWTAGIGEAGSIQLDGAFSRVGEPAGIVDFSIHVNGVQRYTQSAVSAGTAFNFNFSASILTGQTVDFVLGNSDGFYTSDESMLRATITTVPEPAVTALIALGMAALAVSRLKRRSS